MKPVAENLLEMCTDQPRLSVGRAPRRERHDHADRLARIGLGLCGRSRPKRTQSASQTCASPSLAFILLRRSVGAPPNCATRVKRERRRPSLAAFAVPYSAHGEIPDSRKGKDPARVRRAPRRRASRWRRSRRALEKLLNPGIAKGTAGVGSQTGLTGQEKPSPRSGRLPGAGAKEAEPRTGLRPPADNSWDRREDFSAAHRARKSTREGARTLSSPLPLAGRVGEGGWGSFV